MIIGDLPSSEGINDEKMLDLVEFALDGELTKVNELVASLSDRELSLYWAWLDSMVDLVAERLEPYGPVSDQ